MAEIFRAAEKLFDENEFVFPAQNKHGFISRNMHRKWLQKNGWKDESGRPATAHGLRSSFRTWAQDELRGEASLYEHMLMHVSAKGGQVQRAYARSGRFEERRRVNEKWEVFVQVEERAKQDAAKRAEESRWQLNQDVESGERSLRDVEKWARSDTSEQIEYYTQETGRETDLELERRQHYGDEMP